MLHAVRLPVNQDLNICDQGFQLQTFGTRQVIKVHGCSKGSKTGVVIKEIRLTTWDCDFPWCRSPLAELPPEGFKCCGIALSVDAILVRYQSGRPYAEKS